MICGSDSFLEQECHGFSLGENFFNVQRPEFLLQTFWARSFFVGDGAVLCTVGYLATSLAFTQWDQGVYYRHFGLDHSLLLGVCGGGRLSCAL